MKKTPQSELTASDRRVLYPGVFLISFSLLGLEVAFTRLFSVTLSYHYLFLVLSFAMLGLGLGAIAVRVSYTRFAGSRGNGWGRLAGLAGLFSITTIFPVLATVLFPAGLFLLVFTLFLPFFFAGMFLAEVFRAFPALSSRIYGADMVGAGAGAAGAVGLLNILGGPGTVLAFGIVIALAAFMFHVKIPRAKMRRAWLPVLSLAALVVLLGVNFSTAGFGSAAFRDNPDKEIRRALNPGDAGGEIIDTRWSAFGRTDLVAFPDNPSMMAMFIDGTSGTPMYYFNGDIGNPPPEIAMLKQFSGFLPLEFLRDDEKDSALIIGPGGGRDVLLALLAGVKQVTAVEVNGDFVDIVRDYAAYNGGIFTDFDNVSVQVGEGRNFLRGQSEKYDIIMLTLPVIKTSRSFEGYALTENFLLTTDSIQDYLDRLTDEGRLIVIPHNQVEVFRLVSISLAAMEKSGVDEPAAMTHILTLGSDRFPVFVLKKSPFGVADMVSVHGSLHQRPVDMNYSYLPYITPGDNPFHVEAGRFEECSMLNPLLMGVGMGFVRFDDLILEHEEHAFNIAPVSDNSPFFYNIEPGIPGTISLVLWVSSGLLALMVLASLFRRKRTVTPGNIPLSLYPPAYFLLLGAGFMLAEISLLQRITLFLGGPIISVAVSLASLLVGAGLGSLYSGRFSGARFPGVITVASLTVAIILTTYAFITPVLFTSLLGSALPVRLLTTVLLLVIAGFFMGFLFPTGLRLLKEIKREDYIPWVWGINGVASICGSVLTVIIAISIGYSYALLTGAGLYFLLFLLTRLVRLPGTGRPPEGANDEIRAEAWQIQNTGKYGEPPLPRPSRHP